MKTQQVRAVSQIVGTAAVAVLGFVFLTAAAAEKAAKEVRASRFLARYDPGALASGAVKSNGRMKFAVSTVLGVLLGVGSLAPVNAHHVGVFIPKDDNITKNFKDIKFASQAGRFDVALKLFDDGIVHATMEKHEKNLPAGLEDGIRASLKRKDLPGAELRLTVFLAFLTRERVRDAMTRLKDPQRPAEPRREHARKILNAAWRYYNLADFVISRRDPKASAALRMAFEDAQTYLGGTMVDPMWAAGAKVKPAEPDDGKAAAAISLMDRTLDRFISDGARVARAGGAKKFLPRQ